MGIYMSKSINLGSSGDRVGKMSSPTPNFRILLLFIVVLKKYSFFFKIMLQNIENCWFNEKLYSCSYIKRRIMVELYCTIVHMFVGSSGSRGCMVWWEFDSFVIKSGGVIEGEYRNPNIPEG